METKLESQCLEQLKNHVQNCKELHKFQEIIDDKFLLHFVRGKKYDTDKAFSTLKNYFAVRILYKDFFKSIDTKDIPVINKGIIKILKNRDELGRAIYVIDFDKWNPNEVTTDDFCKANVIVLEELWLSESIEINGICIIADMSELSLKHVTMWRPMQLKKMFSLLWNTFPIRYKSVYFINSSWIATHALKVFNPFMPKKLRERIHVWTKEELFKLHDNICPDKLPQSFRIQNSIEIEIETEQKTDAQDFEIWDLEIEERINLKQEFYQRLARLLPS